MKMKWQWIVVMFLIPLSGFGKNLSAPDLETRLNALLSSTNRPSTVPAINARAKGLGEDDRIYFTVVAMELAGQAEEQIKLIKPRIDGRSEYTAKNIFLPCSLVNALFCAGNFAEGNEELIRLSRLELEDIDKADISSSHARRAFQQNRLDEAGRKLAEARKLLRQAVPDKNYRTWRSRLIEYRLKELSGLIASASDLEKGGPAYQAWVEADRAKDFDAYRQVAVKYPGTIFADASNLEAARVQYEKGKALECVRIIDGSKLSSGALAVPAAMLRADAFLFLNKSLTEIRAVYSSALGELKDPAEPEGLTPEQKRCIQPDKPMHRFTRSRYPEWGVRAPGEILAPGLSPAIASYYRYQLLVRLACLAYVGRAPSDAGTLALSLSTFDEVDGEMVGEKRGAGATVLEAMLTEDTGIIPISSFKCTPPSLHAQLIIGMSFYYVYDWRQCRDWMYRALRHTNLKPVEAKNSVLLFAALSEYMPDNNKQALALTGQIDLPRGAQVTASYYYARQLEWSILHMREPRDYAGAMAALQRVLDRAKPDTFFAKRALYY